MKGWMVLALLMPVAGCLGLPPSSLHESQGGTPAPTRVVVAIVDTGVNPYHRVFQGEGAGHLAGEVVDFSNSLPPEIVSLTRAGDFSQRHELDQAFWSSVVPARLYAFEGTNLLAISFNNPTGTSLLHDEGTTFHGTAVSSQVALSHPEAILVMVEAYSLLADPPTRGAELKGLQWAIAQPWIDVITLSFGWPVSDSSLEGIPDALMQAVQAGKIVIVAAGNLPTPAPLGAVAGPPWVISAGGGLPATQGESAISSKAPDVVANFTAMVAENDSTNGFVAREGTSLSAPLVAGQVAKAIHQLRATAGHEGGIRDGALVLFEDRAITNTDLREAFNRTATYWQVTDYRGPNLTEDPFTIALQASVPILPAPWLQMGWGYVGPGTAEAAAAHLLGTQEPVPKPPEAVAHMRAVDAARWAYWG